MTKNEMPVPFKSLIKIDSEIGIYCAKKVVSLSIYKDAKKVRNQLISACKAFIDSRRRK